MSNFFYSQNLVGGYGGENILNDCSISVNKGEISVIVGPNGAGKSTAMKAMLGMLKLSQGKVFLIYLLKIESHLEYHLFHKQ